MHTSTKLFGLSALILGGSSILVSSNLRFPGDHQGYEPEQPIAYSHRLHAGELAIDCRFIDCRHESEPGCAVLAAVESGDLESDRLVSFHKLLKEAAYFERKLDARTANNPKRRWKHIITKADKRRFKDGN